MPAEDPKNGAPGKIIYLGACLIAAVRLAREEKWDNLKSWRTRKAKLARIMRDVPQTPAVDLLTLTVCWRYADSLLKNPHVKKYLMKHHPEELNDLEMLLAELNGSD